MKKILIQNATVIDGTGAERYNADIEIIGDKITRIGDISNDNHKVINVARLVVSPGFIDTHSHSDLKILTERYLRSKIKQGITTEILGQDGISMAPLPEQYVSPWRKNLAGLDGESNAVSWDWKTTEGYLKVLKESGPTSNFAYLVPHGNVRMEAMGLGAEKASRDDLELMKEILERELQAGGIGLSSGLIYPPCSYSNERELIELCKIVAKYDKIFVVHQRNEADNIINSMEEILQIAKQTGVRTHFSHFKVCGVKNRPKIDYVLEMLNYAREEGLKVTFDQYPYNAGSTMLSVILPHWVHEGGTDQLIERLKNPEIRKKIIYDLDNGLPDWDNFVDFAGFHNIFITSVKTKENYKYIGKSLTEIGEMLNKTPYDVVFDLLIEENNSVGMYDIFGEEEDIVRFLKRPEQNVCTDALLNGKPHPRAYGSFPRVLKRYVREQKVLTLEEAIYKMTGKPAKTFQLKDRGQIKVGKKADLVIFDPETIADTSTYVKPISYPEGIHYVFVNGDLVLFEDFIEKTSRGTVIKY